MSTSPRPSPATLSDLDALPEDLIGEIIDGVLYSRNRPSPAHQYAAAGIVSDLVPPFGRGQGTGGWWILPEPALAQPGSPHFAPDVAGWRRERIRALPAGAISVVPDWICEILSPTTRRHDHLVKMPFYARIGVAFAWLVDAESRLVFAHRLDAGEWRPIGTFSDETEARIPPFDAVPLNVSAWWMLTEVSSP